MSRSCAIFTFFLLTLVAACTRTASSTSNTDPVAGDSTGPKGNGSGYSGILDLDNLRSRCFQQSVSESELQIACRVLAALPGGQLEVPTTETPGMEINWDIELPPGLPPLVSRHCNVDARSNTYTCNLIFSSPVTEAVRAAVSASLDNRTTSQVATANRTVQGAVPRFVTMPQNVGGFTDFPDNVTYGVWVDSSKIYATTPGGLAISSDQGATWSTRTTYQGLGSNYTTSVYAAGPLVLVSSGTGTSAGLAKSVDGGLNFVHKKAPTIAEIIDGVSGTFVFGDGMNLPCVFARGSEVAYGSIQGLFYSSTGDGPGKYQHFTNVDGLGNIWVTGIFISGRKLYAATRGGGLSIINLDTRLVESTRNVANSGLADNIVWSVWVDGNKIYASTFGGLSVSTNGGQSFLPAQYPGASVNFVHANGANVIAGSPSRGLLLSTNGGTSFNRVGTTVGLASQSVSGIYASGYTVYVGTGNGLSVSTDGGRTFSSCTTANQLGSNSVTAVAVEGNRLFAGTTGGLSISTNGGALFDNRTTANSALVSNDTRAVKVAGNKVYVGTWGGLSYSENGGTNFVTRNSGLNDVRVRSLALVGNTLYVGTHNGGLYISNDDGNTYQPKTTADGLASNAVYGLFVEGRNVYAATGNGLSISRDGGLSFTERKSIADGLGSNQTWSVLAAAGTVYVSTEEGLSVSEGGGPFRNLAAESGLGVNLRGALFMDNLKLYVGGLFSLFEGSL